MMGGFLVSNLILSVFTFLFGMNALRNVSPKLWLKNKWWLVGIGWVAFYALSYFWSDDKKYWETGLQVKLPFLLLPLAFNYLPRFTAKQLQTITLIMAAMLLAGIGYSLSFLIRDPAHYIWQYNISHLLPTPAYQDHVRFSLAIALFVIWSVYTWPFLLSKTVKWCAGVSMGILVVYLHILAAKSGLIALYLFIIAWSLYLMVVKRKLAGVIIILSIPVFVLFAVKFIPTFWIRSSYVGYSYFMLRDGDRSGNYGDIGRLFSWDIALKIIKQHPINGIGTGDMMTEMKKGYSQWFPTVPDYSRILPHNQFLIVGLGCGIPAMLLFTVWAFMPLAAIKRNRQSFFFFIVWLVLFIQLMIEPIFEVQMGVFVYLFFLLLQKHELPDNGLMAQ
jgi:O-antigen ligase